MEMFLAERDGSVAGRIAAVLNHNHNREHNENLGFFGFFECLDDQETANALLDAVHAWLKAKGVSAVRGPASPSVNDEYGLLVDGFDKPPAILMPYNPPYYAKLLEQYGFTKAKDLYAFYLHQDRVFSEKMVRVAEAVKKRAGLVFRSLNMKDFDNEKKKIHHLYTRGWERNWGEVPLTDDEFEYMAKDLKSIVDPEVVVIAESKGKPVGFGLSLPDLNQVLKDNRRGWLIPAVIRLLLFRKRINYARVIILGVLPEYLNAGIGGVLFYETGRRLTARGYYHGEASWVLEDNTMMTRGAELMNGTKDKTYRIYQMAVR
jgi:GNAT superfamily N-acetyltransferase